jgi:hypothetical protein
MKASAPLLLALLLAAAPTRAAAQAPGPPIDTQRQLHTRVFEIQHGNPESLRDAVALLGSGVGGARMSVNQELRTLTVRDFPENLATIEQALGRLDRPAAASPDVELTFSVLIGAESPLPAAPLPADLVPVVRQLQSTLRYSHFGLLAATVHRTRAGAGLEGSGVADASLLGMTPNEERPILYRYRLRRLGVTADDPPQLDVDELDFSMNVPIATGDGTFQYSPVGFTTPVSIRQGERVVIGTTTMGQRAVVVVVTARIAAAGGGAQ